MNAIVTQERNALAVPEEELLRVLGSSLYPGANPDSIRMVLGYCRATRLDPMQKPVHIVPMWDAKQKAMRDVTMPGVGLYRIQAARTGEHVGTDEPVFGPLVELKFGDQVVQVPEWCRVTVYRLIGGQPRAFTATEYWMENYATASKDSIAPNTMWKKRSRGQIAKCAEAQALRKGFPEVGSQPTAEEMEGKLLEPEYAEPAGATSRQPATPAPTPTATAALQPYPQDRFDANLPEWTTVIQSGRHTAERMIAMLLTKGVLSDAQKKTLRDLEVFDNESAGNAAATTQEPQQ